MANKSSNSKTLNEIMQAQERKNPALAAKQQRLLDLLRTGTSSPQPDVSTPSDASVGKALLTPEALLAQKPQREQFKTEEAYQESLGRWQENQGRILSSAQSKGSLQK
jgi:hypothetical protein